jgi:translation elongation factor EF-1alpha
MGKVVGKVSHYFDHIQVAALTLTGPLAVGDTVKVSGHGQEFTQTITSLQMEKQPVTSGKKGDDIAFKVDRPVKVGDEVSLA